MQVTPCHPFLFLTEQIRNIRRYSALDWLRVLPLALMVISLTSMAHAAEDGEAGSIQRLSASHPGWINFGFLSYHTTHDNKLRDKNYGLGLQIMLNPSASVLAGRYINSIHHDSKYLGYLWQPVNLGPARLGLTAAAIEGYPKMNHGRWFPGILPTLSYEYEAIGFNLTYIPPFADKVRGAFAVQLRLRIW